MRYRLIPTRGTTGSCFVEAEDERQLQHFAEVFAAELDMPVLVVRHPWGGHGFKTLYTVGGDPKKGRTRMIGNPNNPRREAFRVAQLEADAKRAETERKLELQRHFRRERPVATQSDDQA